MKEGERDLKFGNNFCDPSSGGFFLLHLTQHLEIFLYIIVLRK